MLFSFFEPALRLITVRTDSSKTSLRPSRVRALHSKYWHFSSPSMTVLAVSLVMGAVFGSLEFLVYDYRKSILFPTKILAAPGTTCWISGYHCVREVVLFCVRLWTKWALWLRRRWEKHLCLDTQVVSVDRTLPDRRCPWVRVDLPESKVDYPSIDFEGSGEVIKYGWFVLFRKFVLGIARSVCVLPDENASFSDGSVSDDD
jgi:hypothetical protein